MEAQSPKELQPGEHVSWNFGTGQVHGQVVEKLTQDKKLGARVFKASQDDPKYLVKSDTSGKEAIKKPDTLHKTDEDDGDGEGIDNAHPAKGSSKGTKAERTNRSARDVQKGENGAKEKRYGLMQRSTEEEWKEVQEEEMEQKVQKTGKGSAREVVKKKIAAKKRDTEGEDDEFVEEEEEEEEETGEDDDYKPKEEDLKAVEDEEVVSEQEQMKAKDELTELKEAMVDDSGKGAGGEKEKVPLEDFIVEDEEEDEEQQYELTEQEVKAQKETEAAPAHVDLAMAEEVRREENKVGEGGEESIKE